MPDGLTLTRFKAAMDTLYGDRLARVVLFGSRARGDVRADSDSDIAALLKDMPDRYVEMRRPADIGAEILDDAGGVVNAMPYQAETYDDPRMPLMFEIRRRATRPSANNA